MCVYLYIYPIRWYQTDYNKIFVERKVHHEGWGGETTVKSRFTCHAADVPRFLSGEYELESHLTHLTEFRERADQVTELFNEFREKITNTRLFPILRTKYARTAFQYTPHKDCRASLDEDLQMMLEPCDPGDFRRREDVPIREDQVLRFPYAVFELKVENPEAFPDAWPDWVQEMVEDGSFIEVYKYSKFITGIAWLLPERTTVNPGWLPLISEKVRIICPYAQRCNKIPKGSRLTTDVITKDYQLSDLGKQILYTSGNSVILDMMPHIAAGPKSKNNKTKKKKDGDDLRTPLLADADPERPSDFSYVGNNDYAQQYRNNFNQMISRTTFPSFPNHLFEGKPMLMPMKVEPKGYFSMERTMLHWAKFGATVGLVGGDFYFLERPPNYYNVITLLLMIIIILLLLLLLLLLFFFYYYSFVIIIIIIIIIINIYINICMYNIALIVQLTPLTGDGEREKVTGLILTLFGLGMMMYGYLMFRMRLEKFKNRERGPYDDPIGPAIIIIGFIGMLTVRLVIDALDTSSIPGAVDAGNLPCS